MNAPSSEFCARSAELPAYVRGELHDANCRALQAHVATCADCREDLVLLQRMRQDETDSSSVPTGFEDRLRARLPHSAFRPSPATGRSGLLVGVLGTVILVTLLVVLLPRIPMDMPDPAAARTEVLQRLTREIVQAQRPDGSIVSSGPEDQRYSVGITGHAVRALLDAREDAAARASALRGIEYLLRQQGPDGLFGPSATDALYNHAPALTALLAANQAGSDVRLQGPIRKGLSALLVRQKPDGGFGYSDKEESNVVITAWPLEVLLMARAGGQPGLDSAIQRVRDFVRGCITESGIRYSAASQGVGTPVLVAMSAWYAREFGFVTTAPAMTGAAEAMSLGFHVRAGTSGALQRILDCASIPEAVTFPPSWATVTRDPVAAAALTAMALRRAPER